MASIRKRGNSYQITISNGRDNTGKQVLETATLKPDLSKTPKQKVISDMKYFILKQTKEFLNEIETQVQTGILNFQYKVFYHMALFCGLRKEEFR